MRRLLELSFGFPTVVFTTMLLLSLTYWVFAVLAGRIDLEVESEIDIEGGGDVGDGGADVGAFASLLRTFDLHHVPFTVMFTILSLIGWAVSAGVTNFVIAASAASAALLIGTFIALGSFVVSIFLTGRLARALHPFFQAPPHITRRDLIGKICTIQTGRVDRRFGQAEVLDAERSTHLVQVRCEIENELTAGRKALIVDVDDDGIFLVSPDVEAIT